MKCKSQHEDHCDECNQTNDCEDYCECRCLDYYESEWQKQTKIDEMDIRNG